MRKTCTTRAKKTANKRRAREQAKGRTFGMVDLIGFAGMALGAFFGRLLGESIAKEEAKRSRFKLVD